MGAEHLAEEAHPVSGPVDEHLPAGGEGLPDERAGARHELVVVLVDEHVVAVALAGLVLHLPGRAVPTHGSSRSPPTRR